MILLFISANFIVHAEYTWQRVEKFSGLNYDAFAEDSIGNLYFSKDFSLFYSGDDGKSWSLICPPSYNRVKSIACTKDNKFYFTKEDSIFYSVDFGKTINYMKFNNSFTNDNYHFYYQVVVKSDTLIIIQDVSSKIIHDISLHIYFSSDEGINWVENLSKNKLIDSLSLPIYYVYGNQGLYITSALGIFSMKYNESNYAFVKGIDTIYYGLIIPNYVEDESNNLFFANFSTLYRLNSEQNEWEKYPTNYSFFYDVRSFGNSIFFLDGQGLMMSNDNMKTFSKLRSVPQGLAIPPHLFITKKGTLLLIDCDGYLWRGEIISDIQDKVDNNQMLLSPNPAEDFIEITKPTEGLEPTEVSSNAVRIFNVFGEMVSTSVCSADTSAGGGQLRIDVTGLPSGVYFVRVGDKVGKFVKI